MIISDELAIADLQKDAKKFKSKWELNTAVPGRNKPNTKFLARHLGSVVKQNAALMRKPCTWTNLERKRRKLLESVSSSSSDGSHSRSPLRRRALRKRPISPPSTGSSSPWSSISSGRRSSSPISSDNSSSLKGTVKDTIKKSNYYMRERKNELKPGSSGLKMTSKRCISKSKKIKMDVKENPN